MGKINELYLKKAEKAKRHQCTYKGELFSVAIGIDHPNKNVAFANSMSNVVEWKELIFLPDYFF